MKDPIAAFGEACLCAMLQEDWEPDWEWHIDMLHKAEDLGLVRRRPATAEDDTECDFVWERLTERPANPPSCSATPEVKPWTNVCSGRGGSGCDDCDWSGKTPNAQPLSRGDGAPGKELSQ